ncbi:hypothetical protein JW877_02845, partial [bacterium]|nr:hypothetical protein [bacterium]
SNKDSQDDSSFFDNSTHSISFSPYLYFGLFKLYHSLSASYSHTQQQEKNPLNPYVNKTNSASSNLSSQISSGFSTNLGVSWISTHSDGTRVEYMTYSAGANFDLFNGVLPVYSNLSYSPGTAGNLFDAYVSPSLTITSKDVIDFDFNYSNFSTANDDSTDYNEFTFKVSYSRYF